MPKDLKELNCDAGLFFAFRYKGLKELLGRSVSWELGRLLDFPDLDQAWRAGNKPYCNRSVAKAALQIKFFLDLEITLSNGQTESCSIQNSLSGSSIQTPSPPNSTTTGIGC